MTTECNELLSEPDNIEIIREQIGAILSLETQNQYKLAEAAADPAKQDYNITVFIENGDPVQYVDTKHNPFPIVNVTLSKTERDDGSTSVNLHNMHATFLVDVYAAGNMESRVDAGARASLKAWKTARIVRNILDAESYTYLKLRGVVSGRDITSFEAGEPADKNSAVKVAIVRMTLEVDYAEDVAVNNGTDLELIQASVVNDEGEVVVTF